MSEDYTVQQGDCIGSIAFEHGFFWETVWNDPGNAALKSKRKNPNVLLEGDVVHIPDLRLGKESGATEKRHRFKLKGVPAEFNLRILEEAVADGSGGGSKNDKPRANVPYNLYIDGVLVKQGQTDGDGWVKCGISPKAQTGCLILDPGTANETALPLSFGHLDPVDEISGVQARLRNLGFDCGDEQGEIGPQTTEALKEFQGKNGLEANGQLNDATRNKLRQVHDGS